MRDSSVRALLAHHASRFTLLDHQLLIAHVLNRPRTWILAHPEDILASEQQAAFESALARLQGGEPLPYILGHWEFYGLDFLITPDVLIPRPETELLVETALQSAISSQKSEILDVGTGSGCIAITLAFHLPNAHITATDISPAALTVARANAERHHVSERIQLIQADLLDFRPAAYTILAANLPYIPTPTLHGLDVYGKEPTLALDGGPDGLDLIRRLLAAAPAILAPGGLVLLEIEAIQGEAAQSIARQYFSAAAIRILPDSAGLDRMLTIQT